MRILLVSFLAITSVFAQQPVYDLLLKGGHVIDPKNNIDRVMDVAIANRAIAKVAPEIPAGQARRVADVTGLYVTPGLIDIHVHVYAGTGQKALTGDQSVYPDPLSFRAGVTTMVDAGTSGWRNFPDFHQRIIARAQTRVLAMLNIVGAGMEGGNAENNAADMDPVKAAEMAKQYPDVIVGFKSAHYKGDGWPSVDNALKAAKATGLPIMVDFGWVNKERNIRALLEDKLRQGDIYTHCYAGHRQEVMDDGKVNPAMWNGRKRGVIFDLGHGAGSFYWNIAVPAFEQKFYPDSISTDLHTASMNSGVKDMTNVMSKVLILGVPLAEVIRMSTWNPAREINRPKLGNLDVGAEADVTVLRLEKGTFGFLDSAGALYTGTEKLTPEMTIRAGMVRWDLNGRAATDWKKFKYQKRPE